MNDKPLLSICIPTYNRLPYLKELAAMLLPQIDAAPAGEVELLVSDNLSSDGTADFCASVGRSCFRFWTNPTNVGGDRNFLKCIAEARGEYVWLVGDDDLVPHGAVAMVLGILKEHRPDLLTESGAAFAVYRDYGEFLKRNCGKSVMPAMTHTLISANVFRREAFDMDFAVEKLPTCYAHMFGLMKRLEGKVVTVKGIVETRPVRAEFAKFPSCLCVKQGMYMRYLAERFGYPRFRRYAFLSAFNLPMEYASRVKNWLLRLARKVGA